jgi:hypothetical protein
VDKIWAQVPHTEKEKMSISTRVCKVCTDKEKHHIVKATEKVTTVYCPKNHTGLCLGEGFEIYHAKGNYWE